MPYHELDRNERYDIGIITTSWPPEDRPARTAASQGFGGSATVDQEGNTWEGPGQTGPSGQQPGIVYEEEIMLDPLQSNPFASTATSYRQQHLEYGQTGTSGQQPSMGYDEARMLDLLQSNPFVLTTTSYGRQAGAFGQQPSMGYGEETILGQGVSNPYASTTTSSGQQQLGYGQQPSSTRQPHATQTPVLKESSEKSKEVEKVAERTQIKFTHLEILEEQMDDAKRDLDQIREEIIDGNRHQEEEMHAAVSASLKPAKLAKLKEKHRKANEERHKRVSDARIKERVIRKHTREQQEQEQKKRG